MVAYAKANPGKVTYATPGAGTSLHIGMEQIAGHAGIQLTHVPFKGGAETNAAVLGGHTTLQADSTGWKPLVDAGQLRLLAIWTAERSKNWPDAPTLKELGYPFVFDSPFGIAGPKGMDAAVVQKLHDAFKKALEEKAVIDMMAKYDMVPRYHRHRRLPQGRRGVHRQREGGAGKDRPGQEGIAGAAGGSRASWQGKATT